MRPLYSAAIVTPVPEALTAFVNERPVRVPPGADALAAVAALDATLAERVRAGGAYLTDGRGIRCALDTPLVPGAILRVIVPARRGPEAHADA
jgi:hypothetical protein